MAHDHATQNQRQISAQMGRTVRNRNSLFKRSVPPYDFRWRPTHDADQWQVLKEVLSLIKDPSHDQVNITPLIKTFMSKVHAKRAFIFLQARSHTSKEPGHILVLPKENQGYIYANQMIQHP